MSKLMVSISGIRGIVGETLTPEVLINFASAFGEFSGKGKIIVGRDSRVTGEMVQKFVVAALNSVGCEVIQIGIVPTPTVQLMVEQFHADGGIAVTASHNPIQWNAMKLISKTGLFLDGEEGEKVIQIAKNKSFTLATYDKIGNVTNYPKALEDHVKAVFNLPFVDLNLIRSKKFKVVLDTVNGAGGTVLPKLLEKLNCEVIGLNLEPNGIFAHTPEPIPENLVSLMEKVKETKADLGIAIDPDADRCALISEKGEPLSEEYTLALATKLILSKRKGTVVTNLSTTLAVDKIAESFGCEVVRTAVGEINVAKKMKEINATIGGEGNGGVILGDVHYGRDSLVAVVLTLQHLAEFGGKISELHKTLPQFSICKKKLELGKLNPDEVFEMLKNKFSHEKLDFTDGIKILRENSWVHFRKSNTEPIVRIIAEARTSTEAEKLAQSFVDLIAK
ncbi:phosphoglucosamine mutase [bacterium]|nr:phosphoglucosamine mutase [bacterium]